MQTLTPSEPNPVPACPKCGIAFPGNALRGLCPNCLVLVTFGQESAVTAAGPSPPATESAPRGLQPTALLSSTIRYFGDYDLLEEIARGGMGVVYRARQKSLNRIVAVKMILSGQFATDADVRRFHTEAEAAANLKHPNIVAIHEVGEHEGRHYFSMDYIEGRNLAESIKDHPLPAGHAAQLVKTLAEAVHYAHQRGTLHRDLKPQNVLLDVEGHPHITDFGLAKQMKNDSGLTQEGAVLGTPAYMPPEQAAGKQELMGPSSDVYSLGAILYHLLAGRAPFVGATPVDTLRTVMEEEPTAPSKLDSQTPPDLETICLKCLEKRPERRYHSARELAEDLGRFLNREPILAKSASRWRKAWSWSLRNPWAIIGVAVMAGLVLLGVADGLWEQVRFLEWKGLEPGRGYQNLGKIYDPSDVVRLHELVGASLSRGQHYVGLHDPILMVVIGYLMLAPAALYGRFLNHHQKQNLPLSRVQLGILAASGVVMVAVGLWCDLLLIRLYVWMRPFPWQYAVGSCLGAPLLFCWVGGILLWQAARRHQAHWSGAVAVEEDWLPRQPLRYSPVAYLLASVANMALFAVLAQLAIPTGSYDDLFPPGVPATTPEGYVVMRLGFMLMALLVALAVWEYATRKVNRVPTLVTLFVWVSFGGAALLWTSSPARIAWPPVLAGLLGALVLIKSVKIRPAETAAPLPSFRLGDLFQWDKRAFSMTLAGVVSGLAVLAVSFAREDVEAFLCFSLVNLGWPAVVLGARATTGKLREFFLSLTICLSLPGVIAPMMYFGTFTATNMLASIPAGVIAGWVLLRFGKIRAISHVVSANNPADSR